MRFSIVRPLAASPHIAELTASTEALVAEAFETLVRQIRSLLDALLGGSINQDAATDMLPIVGNGTLQPGDTAHPYAAARP
jgi:hypothetical protein